MAVGGTSDAFAAIAVKGGTALSGSTTQRAFDMNALFGTGATSSARAAWLRPTFASGSYTTNAYEGLRIDAVALGGGGHAITTVYGIRVAAQTVGSTNYCIRGEGGQYWFDAGNFTINDGGGDFDTRIEGDALVGAFFLDASADSIQLFATSAAGQFGGGTGVLGITNATTIPTTNPTGGYILYGDPTNGLMILSPSGALTSIAPA
jgi:hypothetical protein